MSSPQQESFQSMATVFILQDKTWIERGSGLVRFVFDLRTFALRLVIRPGTPDEFECKLRPRIRSKGPRAYVVRAQAENGTDEHILAVRFEREEDSRSFRRFVEKRDVDHNQKSNAPNPSNNYPQHLRNQTYDTNNAVPPQQQQQQPPYAQGQQRHGNRTSSNIAQGGYGTYPNAPMTRNNPYSSNTALGMYGNNNANIPHQMSNTSSPSPNKHTNYFWTCSRCLQMVDPSLSSCHVCGTMRQNESQQVLQSISTNNHYNPHPSQQHHAPHQQSNATRATYGSSAHHQIAASSMTPSNNYTHYQNNHNPMMNQNISGNAYYSKQSPKHATKPPTVHILKLTTVNLEKHNKLFPPKRRNVKEIVHAQLEWLRTHQ